MSTSDDDPGLFLIIIFIIIFNQKLRHENMIFLGENFFRSPEASNLVNTNCFFVMRLAAEKRPLKKIVLI
jgi:hypothetical protein